MKILVFIVSMIAFSCTYKVNPDSKRGNFWVRQAHKITTKNNNERDSKVAKQTKKNEELSKKTQDENEKTSKVKKPKKHKGEFKFY